MAIQTIGTIKDYFGAGKFPTQSNYEDLIDTLYNAGVSGGQVKHISMTNYSGSTPPYGPYDVIPINTILPSSSNNNYSSYRNQFVDSTVYVIHNDNIYYGNNNGSYTDQTTGNTHPFNFAIYIAWVGSGHEGTEQCMSHEPRYYNGNSAIPQIVEIPLGTCAAFAFNPSTSSCQYIGGGIVRTAAELAELKATGTISSSNATSGTGGAQIIDAADYYNEINNAYYDRNGAYYTNEAPYTAIRIEDIISAAGLTVEEGGIVAVLNKSWSNPSSAEAWDMYISCGNLPDSTYHYTVIESNQVATFIKADGDYYPIDRPTTITAYELNQMAQDNSGEGYLS